MFESFAAAVVSAIPQEQRTAGRILRTGTAARISAEVYRVTQRDLIADREP